MKERRIRRIPSVRERGHLFRNAKTQQANTMVTKAILYKIICQVLFFFFLYARKTVFLFFFFCFPIPSREHNSCFSVSRHRADGTARMCDIRIKTDTPARRGCLRGPMSSEWIATAAINYFTFTLITVV